MFTPAESVFFQCLKYSKVIKIICFCEHKKTLKPAEASRLCSEKGRPSNDKIYSTRILCIDCKQNKLQKYWWTKCTQIIFKVCINNYDFIYSDYQSRNTVIPASTSKANFHMRRNKEMSLYVKIDLLIDRKKYCYV